jgi:hypothetical protein
MQKKEEEEGDLKNFGISVSMWAKIQNMLQEYPENAISDLHSSKLSKSYQMLEKLVLCS